MSKVRFYVDVPEYRRSDWTLVASTKVYQSSAVEGFKRIAFDVEMPPEVWKGFDLPATASNAHFAITDEEPTDEA